MDWEAGSELDKRVAVEVMGWRYNGSHWAEPGSDNFDMHSDEIPPFSTEWERARAVINRMLELNWCLRLGINGDPGQVVACFYRAIGAEHMLTGPLHDGWSDVRETVPHAVCTAALGRIASLARMAGR